MFLDIWEWSEMKEHHLYSYFVAIKVKKKKKKKVWNYKT